MLVLWTNILLFYVQYLSILNLIGKSIARRRLEYSLPVLSQLGQTIHKTVRIKKGI